MKAQGVATNNPDIDEHVVLELAMSQTKPA
jgi:hypothetical protein